MSSLDKMISIAEHLTRKNEDLEEQMKSVVQRNMELSAENARLRHESGERDG